MKNGLKQIKQQAVKALTPEQLRIARTLYNRARIYQPNFLLGESGPLINKGDAVKAIKNYLAPIANQPQAKALPSADRAVNYILGKGSELKQAVRPTAQAVKKQLPSVVKSISQAGPELNTLFGDGVVNGAKAFGEKLGAGATSVGSKALGKALGVPALATEALLRGGNYLNNMAIGNAGEQFNINQGDPLATLQAQQRMQDSYSPFISNVLGTPGINQATLQAYLDQQSQGANTPQSTGGPPTNLPVVTDGGGNGGSLPPVPTSQGFGGEGGGMPPSNIDLVGGNYVPEFAPINDPSLPQTQTAVPNGIPQGVAGATNPQQLLSALGIVNQGVPTGGASNLGEQIGINYQPSSTEMPGIIAPDRFNAIMDTLNISPNDYRDMYRKDAQNAGMQAIANRYSNINLKPYSTIAENDALRDYLTKGYNTEQDIVNTQRALTEAYDMANATGLPASYFMNPEKSMQYIVEPLIKGLEQRKGYKEVLGNDLAVQQLKNMMKKYEIDVGANTEANKLANAWNIARMTNDTKAMTGVLQSAIFMPDVSFSDLLKLTQGVVSPEVAGTIGALKQTMSQTDKNGKNTMDTPDNRAKVQAILYQMFGNR